MDYTTIRVERRGPVARVRLHRPERMNAVIEAMYRELQRAFADAVADDEVRALLLTGTVWHRESGDKPVFCAGADLKEHASGRRSPEQQRAYIELAHETTRQLAELPLPTVVAVNGPARGAGAELALCGDLLLMADGATLAFPETSLGTLVGGGVTRHLVERVGAMRARQLIFGGDVVDGPAAVGMGLALASHPLDALEPAALELASTLAARAPVSMRLAKQLLATSPGRPLADVLAAETEGILACMDTEDWHEGVASFAQKRAPVYRGR